MTSGAESLSAWASLPVSLAFSLNRDVTAGLTMALCVAAGVAIFFRRRKTAKYPEDVGLYECLLIGSGVVMVPLGLFFWLGCFRVTVTDGTDADDRVVFVRASFDDGAGGTVAVRETSVVNRSAAPMVLELVLYGDAEPGDEPPARLLPPHSATPVADARVEFGPRQTPPQEMRIEGDGRKRWLRNLSDEEAELFTPPDPELAARIQRLMEAIGLDESAP